MADSLDRTMAEYANKTIDAYLAKIIIDNPLEDKRIEFGRCKDISVALKNQSEQPTNPQLRELLVNFTVSIRIK